jgi:hypothetical protein
VYALHVGGFDIIVNADHVLSWGVTVEQIQDAALRNLAEWSAGAAWTDEVSGERRLISSDTARAGTRRGSSCPRSSTGCRGSWARSGASSSGSRSGTCSSPAASGRATGTSRRSSPSSSVEQSGGADEPIDRRVFELSDGSAHRVRGRAGTGLSSMADLRVETADGVATVTLDRPDALNALTIPLKEALIAAFVALAADPMSGRSS